MITKAMPRAIPSMPRVAMKGGILPLVMTMPLIQPANVPIARPAMAAMRGSTPFSISQPMVTALRARIEPTDRSIPPEMMTTAWPAARMATIETCFIRLVMLPRVMK